MASITHSPSVRKHYDQFALALDAIEAAFHPRPFSEAFFFFFSMPVAGLGGRRIQLEDLIYGHVHSCRA